MIWYQGESDAEIIDNAQNGMLLKTMISSWRKAFRNPEMPFVMIQLPRINDPSKIRAGWPEFREMHDTVAKTVPQVYSVNTIDPWLHQWPTFILRSSALLGNVQEILP